MELRTILGALPAGLLALVLSACAGPGEAPSPIPAPPTAMPSPAGAPRPVASPTPPPPTATPQSTATPAPAPTLTPRPTATPPSPMATAAPPVPTATPAATATPVSRTSNIQGFQLESFTVTLGTTVTWVNRDGVPHTSTSQAFPRVWQSDTLNPGQSYSFAFTKAGTYDYFCVFHPFMTGTVTVLG